jgi:lipopolysaccharide heptosyltransferase II
MSTLNKTLVIRFSSIGDIILASPLLRVLRKKYPSLQIDFVTRKEFSDIVRYNPNINRIYEIDAAKGFKELISLKTSIQREQYDLIVDIHNSLRSRYIRLFNEAGENVVIDKRVWERAMLVNFKKNYYRGIVSVADRYIEPLKKYGVENDNKGLELFIPDEIRTKVSSSIAELKLNASGKVIGFCPSAKHATKCWPAERFVELGMRLVKDYDAKILVFGGPADIDKNKSVADKINASGQNGSAIDFSGKLALLETAAAMEFCDILVTNDSGLMHIAAAMKRKVVAIFGSTVEEFGFFPIGTENIVLERKGLYCRPCSHIGRDECPEKHFRCMNEIQVADVLKSVREIDKN